MRPTTQRHGLTFGWKGPPGSLVPLREAGSAGKTGGKPTAQPVKLQAAVTAGRAPAVTVGHD